MDVMEHNLLFLASDVARLARRRLDVANRSLGVTGPQWRVLLNIARNPGINQGALADNLDVEPITACRMVDRLEQAGLVERRRDPLDRRAWQLYLTAAADPLTGKLKHHGEQILETALSGLTTQEADQLGKLLERLRENLLRQDDDCPAPERTMSHG